MATKKKLNLEAEIENLPDLPRSNPRNWTAEQDRLILKWVPIKGAPAVASILLIPTTTVRKRWHDLKGKK